MSASGSPVGSSDSTTPPSVTGYAAKRRPAPTRRCGNGCDSGLTTIRAGFSAAPTTPPARRLVCQPHTPAATLARGGPAGAAASPPQRLDSSTTTTMIVDAQPGVGGGLTPGFELGVS